MSMLLARYSSISASNLSTCNTLKSVRWPSPRRPRPISTHASPFLLKLIKSSEASAAGLACVQYLPRGSVCLSSQLPNDGHHIPRKASSPHPVRRARLQVAVSHIASICDRLHFLTELLLIWLMFLASVRAGERPSLLRPLLSRVLVCNFTTALDSLPFSGVFYPKSLEGSAVKGTHFLLLP